MEAYESLHSTLTNPMVENTNPIVGNTNPTSVNDVSSFDQLISSFAFSSHGTNTTHQPLVSPSPAITSLSPAIASPSPAIASSEENGIIYTLTHNNSPIYGIKRGSQWYFLQKHLGQAFYSNQNTFNSTCWNHKIPKVAATSHELKVIRDNDPSEHGLKKSTLLSLDTFEQLCKAIKKPDIYNMLYDLLKQVDLTKPLNLNPHPVSTKNKLLSPQIPSQSYQIPPQSYQIPPQSYQIPLQSYQIPLQSSQIPLQSSPQLPPASFRVSPVSNQIPEVIHKKSDGKTCKKKYTLSEQLHSPSLVNQLVQLEKYWTQPNNLLRKDPMVNQVTHKKRKERILCFMGWSLEIHHVPQPDLTLYDISKSPENRERYEIYLDYLKNERKLNAGTMVEHFTAAIYALKYLFSSQADSKFSNIPPILQLRLLRNEYQRGYEKGLKSQNWVELREEDRFLHYEEIQQVLKCLMNEFLEGHKDPKQVYGATKKPILEKAKQLQRFLILLFYTSLPPSRALEVRTLQHGTSLQFRKTTNTWWLVLTEFKTIRHKGIDSVELSPTSQKVLITFLELFLNEYRPHLISHWWDKKKKLNLMIVDSQRVDDQYLFVPHGNTKNQCYAESAWSAMICALFKEKTGMPISINCLRSSFVTYFYDSDASQNLNLRESIASGMRHSVSEAQKTYDRRTSYEKKRKGVDWCGNNTMKWLSGDGQEEIIAPSPKVIKRGPTPTLQYDDNEPHCHAPNLGDIVAVPFSDDDNKPSFWLGKCLRVNMEDATILLGWFQHIDREKYKMKIGASWSENIKTCIFPIDVKYDDRNHTYTLLTPTQDILSTLSSE